MAWMVVNPKLLGDDCRNSHTSPKIVVVAGLQRSGYENVQQLPFLNDVQSGLGPWMRFGFQCLHAAYLQGSLPTVYRRLGSPNNFHYFADCPAIQQELSCKPTASFQLGCASLRSHKLLYA
jgi:hypothetical protein